MSRFFDLLYFLSPLSFVLLSFLLFLQFYNAVVFLVSKFNELLLFDVNDAEYVMVYCFSCQGAGLLRNLCTC